MPDFRLITSARWQGAARANSYESMRTLNASAAGPDLDIAARLKLQAPFYNPGQN